MTLVDDINPPVWNDSPCKNNINPSEPTKVPLMQPMAIEIAARKIANTGDLRKALDVCRYELNL